MASAFIKKQHCFRLEMFTGGRSVPLGGPVILLGNFGSVGYLLKGGRGGGRYWYASFLLKKMA